MPPSFLLYQTQLIIRRRLFRNIFLEIEIDWSYLSGLIHSIMRWQAVLAHCKLLHVWLLLCRWLVGLSYRVVYNQDPIPSNRGRAKLLGDEMVHVHGEIYVDSTIAKPEAQPAGRARNFDDHTWTKYSEARPTYPVMPCLQSYSSAFTAWHC